MSNLGDPPPVAETLAALRAAVAGTAYPLALPGAREARAAGEALLDQLDDYLVPRLARLDAPLLVVVGGSTGAGKSTLVNSLVEAPVTTAGVLRPTTRAPVLVCHPGDAPWFRQPHVLPGLVRTIAPAPTPDSLHLVSAHALIPGLALLDAPDIDSVLDSNRALANQLLAAADLWLFVTTAARYADAVPWGLLGTARDRGSALALVLDRVPREATDEITAHFTELLAAHGLGDAPLFVVPETIVDGQGLLPDRVVVQLRTWLSELARDADARDRVVRRTVAGALRAAAETAHGLAAAASDQLAAAHDLTDRVRVAYQAALSNVAEGVADGTPLRGPVLARWREFVNSGELSAALHARLGGLGNHIVTTVTGRRPPGAKLKTAIRSSLATLVSWAGTDAAERAAVRWRAHPAGAALLAAVRHGQAPGPPVPVDLGRPSADLTWRAELLVREWQRRLPRRVRAELADARTTPYAVNATGLLVMLAALAGTAIPAELAAAVGARDTTARLFETVMNDQAVRELAARAREDLLARVGRLFDEEEERYLSVLAAAGIQLDVAERLREAAEALARAATTSEFEPLDRADAEPGAVQRTEPGAEPEPQSEPEPGAEPEPEPQAEPERVPVSVPAQRTRRKARRRAP